MTGRRAAVVGGGLGGLSAAIHLARSGAEVSLFEAGPRLGGRANRLELPGGYLFDTGPSLLDYPWLFREVFEEAGRDLDTELDLLPVEPALTFAWRDGTRFQLTSDLDRLTAECERLEPGSRAGLAAFLHDGAVKYRVAFDKLVTRNEDSPARWMLALSAAEAGRMSLWRSLYGELSRYFREPRLAEALGCYAMYLGGSPFELPGFFTLLPFGEIAHGLWLPRGGIYSLVEAFRRLAEGLGVEIATDRPVARIETSASGEVSGLRFAPGPHGGDGPERVDASVVVSNVDVPTTDTRLAVDGAGRPLSKKAARRARKMRMTPGVVTFYWALDTQVEDLPHHTVFLPDDYRHSFEQLASKGEIPDDLPFYVAVASATDPELAPVGGSTVFVLVPTPVLSELSELAFAGDEDALVDGLRERVLARLAEQGVAVPRERIVHEEVWTPTEWGERFGLYDGSAFGAAHTLFQVGPFRARNVSSDVPGLYYAGASTTPGTGMPMVTLSGRLAARRVVDAWDGARRGNGRG